MRARGVDATLLSAVLGMLGFGLVMVFSASSVEAGVVNHNAYFYLERQAIWAILGLTLMAILSRMDYHLLRRYAGPIAAATLFLLIIVLVPHVGRNINGAQRWLGFGSLLFQPSELAKFSVVLLFARYLSGDVDVRSYTQGILFPLGLLAVFAGLIVREPDLGTSVALGATVFVMLFVSGVRGWHLASLGGVAVAAVVGLIVAAPYRLSRFLAFLHPQSDPQGTGYHIIQSLYALGSGGLFGVGLGGSALKYFYLPEQHTDFIYAIIGEELGLVGTTLVLLLFFIVAWRGLRTAMLAPDRFGAVLAAGLTAMIAVQALVNIAVVTASMPITGIPLPFVSYGGSSLVFALAGVGVLLSVSRQRVRQ